jgi:hypothetical protein
LGITRYFRDGGLAGRRYCELSELLRARTAVAEIEQPDQVATAPFAVRAPLPGSFQDLVNCCALACGQQPTSLPPL